MCLGDSVGNGFMLNCFHRSPCGITRTTCVLVTVLVMGSCWTVSVTTAGTSRRCCCFPPSCSIRLRREIKLFISFIPSRPKPKPGHGEKIGRETEITLRRIVYENGDEICKMY